MDTALQLRYEIDVEDVEYIRHGDKPLLARVYRPRGKWPFSAGRRNTRRRMVLLRTRPAGRSDSRGCREKRDRGGGAGFPHATRRTLPGVDCRHQFCDPLVQVAGRALQLRCAGGCHHGQFKRRTSGDAGRHAAARFPLRGAAKAAGCGAGHRCERVLRRALLAGDRPAGTLRVCAETEGRGPALTRPSSTRSETARITTATGRPGRRWQKAAPCARSSAAKKPPCRRCSTYKAPSTSRTRGRTWIVSSPPTARPAAASTSTSTRVKAKVSSCTNRIYRLLQTHLEK